MTATITTKILLIVIGILIVSGVGFAIYQHHEMSVMQTQINSSLVAQKQLADGITRSSSQYVTKDDLNAFATTSGANLAEIQKDLNTLNATITGVNNVSVSSAGVDKTNMASTSTAVNPTPGAIPTVTCDGKQIPCPNADPFGYQSNLQNFSLSEPFGTTQVPVGTVSFNAASKTPWDENLYPRTYDVANVLGTDANGKHYIYNTFTITANGKTYPLTINNSKYEEQYPSPSFSFWNPRLFLTAGGGVDITKFSGSANAGGTIQIMSYGKTKSSPAISILQLGAGFETQTQKAAVILNPVMFNIGGLLPNGMIDNTYIGPSLQMDFGGNIFVGLNVAVGL
jgi:hypothetical protein